MLARRRAVSEISRCTAVQRPMTSLTGSVPERPKVPASRVVVKARIPQPSKSPMTSLGTSTTLLSTVVNSSDRRAEGVEPLIDALVAALDLADVVDEARTIRAECGPQHSHSGAHVGGFEEGATKPRGAVYQRPVRVAKDDTSAHRRKLVDEEHARLEH